MNTKRLLLIVSLFYTTLLFSQPSITSDVFGTAGVSYTMKGIEEISFDPGDGGADVVWDFSEAELNGGTDIREVVDAATSTYGADFPDANIATVTNDTSFTYYFISSALLSYYGTETPSINQVFDEPADLVDFPVTYNDTKTDECSGSATVLGFDAILTGSSTMVADGYGTVILPGGATYSDVLRIRLDLNIEAEVVGFPVTGEINTTFYYWLMNGITGPVIQYTSAETAISGFPTSPAIFIDMNEALLDDISTVHPVSFSVQPTLAHDIIQISSEQHGIISMYTMTGEKVYTGESDVHNTIDVQNFNAGNYIVKLQTETGSATKMITVSH